MTMRKTPAPIPVFPIGSTILVVESDPTLAARTRDALTARAARAVVVAGGCDEAIDAAARVSLDVAVISARLADESGLFVVAAIAERSDACFCVLLVDVVRDWIVAAARRLGARGVIAREAFYGSDPVDAIQHARAHASGPTPEEIRVALRTLLQSAMQDARGGPRAREARVLWSLGLTDKEASAALGVSRPTYREALVSAGAFGNAVRGGATLLKLAVSGGGAAELLAPWISSVTRDRVLEMIDADVRRDAALRSVGW